MENIGIIRLESDFIDKSKGYFASTWGLKILVSEVRFPLWPPPFARSRPETWRQLSIIQHDFPNRSTPIHDFQLLSSKPTNDRLENKICADIALCTYCQYKYWTLSANHEGERKWFQSVLVADCSVHTRESLSKRSKTRKKEECCLTIRSGRKDWLRDSY